MGNLIMNKFFKVNPESYEETRLSIDSILGLSNGETIIEPLSTAPKKTNGDVVISIRSVHCSVQPFLNAINSLVENGTAIEISKDEYNSVFPAGNGLSLGA